MAKSNKDSDVAKESAEHGPCESLSGPIAGTALIQGETFSRKAVQYAEVDGMAIFEGDIVLGTVEEVRQATEALRASVSTDGNPVLMSVGITGSNFRWPNATIPYEFGPGFLNPQRVTTAIAHWEANTRIRFVLRTAANQAQFPDFVRFVNGSGCSSNIGRRGGAQTITLGSDCSSGNAIHEIGHTVGLWHEQSREDRDSFVRIEWANIKTGMEHNFEQHITDGDDLGAYDYGSIMHYPLTAFTKNGQPTITTLQTVPPGVIIGQRTALSAGDIAGVHTMYPAPKPPFGDPNITIKEVQKDPISDITAKEIRKDPISDITLKEINRDPIGPIGPGTIREVIGGLQPGAGATPFILGGASQFGAAADPGATIASELQTLAEALLVTQQQLAQIATAYDTLVQSLNAARGGNS